MGGPHSEFCLPPLPGVQSSAINLRNLTGGGLCKEELTVKTRPHPQELKNVDLFRRPYSLYMTEICFNVSICEQAEHNHRRCPLIPLQNLDITSRMIASALNLRLPGTEGRSGGDAVTVVVCY